MNNKEKIAKEKADKKLDKLKEELNEDLKIRREITHNLGKNFELYERIQKYLSNEQNILGRKDFEILSFNTIKIIYMDLCKLTRKSETFTSLEKLLSTFKPGYENHVKYYAIKLLNIIKPLQTQYEKNEDMIENRLTHVRDKYIAHRDVDYNPELRLTLDELKSLHLTFKNIIQTISIEIGKADISDRDFIQPPLNNQLNVFNYLSMLSKDNTELVLDCKLKNKETNDIININESLTIPYINMINKFMEEDLLISLQKKYPNYNIIEHQLSCKMKLNHQ